MKISFVPLRTVRLVGMVGFALFAITCTGCVDLTGLPNDPVAQTVTPGNAHVYQYPGHLYAMRGFLGIFSTGMDKLTNRLNQDHIVASAAVADEARSSLRKFIIKEEIAGRMTGPLILVGHSWGADDAVRIARALGRSGIKVNLLLLIDPVTPPGIPPNVIRCVDIYKSHPLTDWMPLWRGVTIYAKNPAMTNLTDINLRTAKVDFDTTVVNHINISAVPGVQRMMRNFILDTLKRDASASVASGPSTASPLIPAQPQAGTGMTKPAPGGTIKQ